MRLNLLCSYAILALIFSNITFAHQNPPNIILMLSDDQAWDGTSVQMHPDYENSKSSIIETPSLEALAAQGMRFSAAYAPAPVCSPTRISLQTGRSPAALQWTKAEPVARAKGNASYQLIPPQLEKSLSNEELTIAELLKEAGYATAHYGKWHINGGGPENHGYDESDGNIGNEVSSRHKDPNPVDIYGMTDRAIAFMKAQQSAQKPFYIQMSYHALHSPENASQANIGYYEAKFPRGTRERSIQRAALTTDLDSGVGQLVAAVDALGIAENTYIIYMSDNGSGASKRGGGLLSGGKGSLGEGGIRSPMIVRGPGIEAGSWSHQQVVGYDLLPTFCKLADADIPADTAFEGGDIAHLFKGQEKPVERPLGGMIFHFPHYQSTPPQSAYYEGDYKLLWDYETKSGQLFKITTDISEKTDLAESEPKRAAEMAKAMANYLKQIEASLPIENPDYAPDAASWQSLRAKKRSSGSSGPRK